MVTGAFLGWSGSRFSLRGAVETAMLRAMAVGNQRRRILAVTFTNMGCYRELVQGISSYGNTEGRWHLQIFPPDLDFVEVIESSNPDGLLLGPIDDIQLGHRAVELVPCSVAVCRGYYDSELPLAAVESDDVAVGKLGAEHLLAKGFCHYAFVAQEGEAWSQLRQRGFQQTLAGAGYSVAVYEIARGLTLHKPVPSNPRHGELNRWLEQQPKPLGVLACNDSVARVISRFCLDLGLRVPDDVAILGVDNDDLSTAISNPPLSSVIVPWRSMGRVASQLLDRLIDGDVVPPVLQRIAPAGVAERQSTGSVAIEDNQLRSAVRFIREHSGNQITVDDVVEETGTTRRALERKFRSILGRSPLEEIRRCRIERARVLLSQTGLSIKQVAKQSGFGSLTWFTTAFREITGESPASYRLRARHSSAPQ